VTVWAVWHGSDVEQLALVSAISRNCSCEFDELDRRLGMCPAHRMLMEDQRALNGLLFARHIAMRLTAEENCTNSREASLKGDPDRSGP
jgi:hypothetical protein